MVELHRISLSVAGIGACRMARGRRAVQMGRSSTGQSPVPPSTMLALPVSGGTGLCPVLFGDESLSRCGESRQGRGAASNARHASLDVRPQRHENWLHRARRGVCSAPENVDEVPPVRAGSSRAIPVGTRMSIHVGLNHVTAYRYDRPVALSPHVVRLRPAPHCRTPILAYSLKIAPENHFINWQQDPFGNYLARLVFPETAPRAGVRGRSGRRHDGDQSVRLLPRGVGADSFPFRYDEAAGAGAGAVPRGRASAARCCTRWLAGVDRTPRRHRRLPGRR